jgi:hypothetical protein
MYGMTDKAEKCRNCGRDIRFIKTVKGKTMPVDPDQVRVIPTLDGKPYIRPDGVYVYGRIAVDADNDPDSEAEKAYVIHLATCPEANHSGR